MKLHKADERDKKRKKKKNGMVVGSRSVFIIQEQLIERPEKNKRKNVTQKK